jgi:hypothetical protein
MVGDVAAEDDVDSLPEVDGVGGPISLSWSKEFIGARRGDTLWSVSSVSDVIPGKVIVKGDVRVEAECCDNFDENCRAV